MLYVFSSQPKTIENYLTSRGMKYELVDKEKYGVFLQSYIPLGGDIGIVYDFGKIIPESLLQNLLLLNIHFSLLPKYRGAVPVEAAILSGETETGITIQKMVKGMDAGDILLQEKINIEPTWTAGQLQQHMDERLPILLDQLFALNQEAWTYTPQEGDPSFCYIKWLDRANAEIHFDSMTAKEVVRKVRAYNPEPLAWAKVTRSGKELEMNLLRASIYSEASLLPKQLQFIKKIGLVIGTKEGSVLLTHLVISGSNALEDGDIVSLKGALSLL